jgi:biopolymer transport protein ExbB
VNMKTASRIALAATFAMGFAPLAAAQATKEAPTMGFGEILEGGGTIGWVIIALSVVGVGLLIEMIVNMRKIKLAPPELVEEIESLVESGEYQEAMELCEANPCYFTNIVAAGLPRLNHSFELLEKTVQEVSEEEQLKLFMKLGWLSVIASIAPMLGLLGTVQGMILAFKVIASTKGAAEPADLADNISIALITTLDGLVVSIPMTVAFVFMRNRVVMTTLEVATVVQDLFERFRPAKS